MPIPASEGMILNYLPKGAKVSKLPSSGGPHLFHIIADDFQAVLNGVEGLKSVEFVTGAFLFGPGQLFPIKKP